MQCEEVREKFADHVTSGVETPLPSQIALHVATCDSCRTELADVDELGSVWAAMEFIPELESTPEARSRFDLMIGAYQEGLSQASSYRGWSRRLSLQFALGAALLALGVGVGHQIRPVQSSADNQRSLEVAGLRAELMDTKQMVALSLMQQQSASERLRGVNWSYDLQQPGEKVLTALLETLMHDQSVNVRLATVDALRQFGDRPVVRKGVIEAITRQESPMVQVALIDLAVDLREKESIATLRVLSQDQNLDTTVRERAEKGLAELE
jgi:HEAT repeat protein